MDSRDWSDGHARAVAVFLNGEAIPEPDPRGERIVDDSFLVLFNGHYEPVEFTLPSKEYGATWQVVLDTTDALPDLEGSHEASSPVTLEARSTVVLRRPKPARGTS